MQPLSHYKQMIQPIDAETLKTLV